MNQISNALAVNKKKIIVHNCLQIYNIRQMMCNDFIPTYYDRISFRGVNYAKKRVRLCNSCWEKERNIVDHVLYSEITYSNEII